MAKTNNLYESGQGKLGNLIFYQIRGNGYVRTKASHFKDRKSPAQLAQRQRLSVTTEFLRPFSGLFRITFASEAIGHSAMQAAQSFTMRHALGGSYPDIHVEKSKVLLSKGLLPLPVYAKATKLPEGICIEWENGEEVSGKAASDTLIVIARSAATGRVDYRITGIRRSEGRFVWKTVLHENDDAMPDLWIAFRNSKETDLSNSMYLNSQ